MSDRAEILYRRLMSVADDFGRFHAHPALIRAACYPLQLEKLTEQDVAKLLQELVAQELVSIYHGGKCLQIWRFRQQRRGQSKHPQPSEPDMLIKLKSDALQLEYNIDGVPPSSSTTSVHGNGQIRRRWHIRNDRADIKERIKEIKVQAGMAYDGQRWIGNLDPTSRRKIETLREQDKSLQEEFDQAPP